VTASASALIGVLGAAFASMGVYAARGRRRDADVEGKDAHFFMGAGDFLLHWFMWAVRPAERASLRLRLTADFYNYAGLALGLASGILVGLGLLGAGGWALAACGICDILDGRIARLTGVASNYGDFIDSTFDRFVEVFVFLGFAAFFRDWTFGPLLAAAAMGASLLVSYARARGEVLGVLCAGGLMQRGERLALLCLVCVSDAPLAAALRLRPGTIVWWTLLALTVTSFLTAVHRTFWIARRLRP
jgi:phosphatidylinositol phosphate synthase